MPFENNVDSNSQVEPLPYNDNDILGVSSYVRLRRESNKITVAYIPHMTLQYGVARPEQAIIFSLFNGKRTLGEVIRMVALTSSNDLKKARELVTETVRFLTPDLEMLVKANGNPIASLPAPKDLIIPSDCLELDTRLEAPLVMMLQPTLSCETNCVYCYAVRRELPSQKLLSLERIKEILDECVEIGVYQLSLCGGDGFCRPDFVDIIQASVDRGIVTDISTKASIDKETAMRIADTGLDYIQISLDSSRSEIADKLYGRPGHFKKVVESIKTLIKAGVYTRTNSILTIYNVDHIEETVTFLAGLGINDLKFTPCFRSMHTDNFYCMLSFEQIAEAEKEVKRLTEKFAERGVAISYSSQADYTQMTKEEKDNYWFHQRPRCSGGRANMTIGPDGIVTICEEAPQTPEFQVGDLKKQSIVEVWESDAIKKFTYPKRELFAGTVCEDCKDFDGCTHLMGHCFRDSLKVYGSSFAPNPFCPHAPYADKRLY